MAPRRKPKRSQPDGSSEDAKARLAELFQRNGYVRLPRMERREKLRAKYKKGWEVRLVLKSEEELEEARQLLQRVGFKPGRPFSKARQHVLPIYGKTAMDYFLAPRRSRG